MNIKIVIKYTQIYTKPCIMCSKRHANDAWKVIKTHFFILMEVPLLAYIKAGAKSK